MMAYRQFRLIGVTWVLFLMFSPALFADAPGPSNKRSAVSAMYAEYRQSFPEVPDLKPAEAMGLFEAGELVFVDVREPEEIQVSTLPGAIDKETFLSRKTDFEGKTLVAYCTIGYRSGVFAQQMAREGLEVINLAGGILAWTLADGKVFDHQGETRRLHVYGPKWDLAPADYDTRHFGLLKRLSP